MKQYTRLDLPSEPIIKKLRHSAWNQSVSYSHKTVPDYWFEDTVYLYGVDLFNVQLFWEAHEIWEKKWHYVKAHHKHFADFMQGMIQVSAAFLKFKEGNAQGFLSNMEKASIRLQMYQGQKQVMGVDVNQLRIDLRTFSTPPECIQQAHQGYPKIELTFP